MKLEGEQILLRIFMKASDKKGKVIPLYRYMVKRIREENMAGVTVFKSFMGFLGYNDRIVKESFFQHSHLPVILEVVDEPKKINAFIDLEWEYLKYHILTSERARVIIYTSGDGEEKKTLKELSVISTAKDTRRGDVMLKDVKEKVLIRAFIGDSDIEKNGKKYLYEYIIEEAKKLNFLFAFSYKGIVGFGKKGKLKEIETIEYSSNLPVCVELVGDEEKAVKMINMLNEHVESGLITVEKVNVYVNKFQ